ncbi:MAG: hypothetical protein KKD69_06825 [Euryarchaeota archaeon]|nr:hypothetical protein [Euryarchaeota archaeon]MBU4492159.1 hypothetical protein [Euryarchaeota archaeon]MCG2728234.1 hypothetical protein [Candidatus Methanoperedenaceae archaeon]
MIYIVQDKEHARCSSKKHEHEIHLKEIMISSIHPSPDIVDVHLQLIVYIINDAESKYKRNKVARYDILDALSAAVTAMLGINGTIPKSPQFDSNGLPMEMVYHVPSIAR